MSWSQWKKLTGIGGGIWNLISPRKWKSWKGQPWKKTVNPRTLYQWMFLQSPYRSEIVSNRRTQVRSGRGRQRCLVLNVMTRACFWREQFLWVYILSFHILKRSNGWARLPSIVIFLWRTLVLWLSICFWDNLINLSHLYYSILFASDTERVHVWLIHMDCCNCIMINVWL